MFFTNIICAQTFVLKGKILDKKEPIMGARIFLNNKFTGNSNSTGAFEITVKLGDSIKVANSFYKDFALVVKDSLYQNIELKITEFQLQDVSITFSKDKTIDSLLKSVFSKLDSLEASKKVFLRQTVVKNNRKVILANEGILSVKWPPFKKLSILSGGYEQILVGINSTCQTYDSKIFINYASNPQIKLRRGLIPNFFYAEVKENINRKNINYDSSRTVIDIYGELKEYRLKFKYVYSINSQTHELIGIQYYEENLTDNDFFFIDCNYKYNSLLSVYSSATQTRRGLSYSTSDELFLSKTSNDLNWRIPFNVNKCGLHLYLKETADCDAISKYKRLNNIPEQKYF